MKLETASLKAVRYACLNFHYSKSVPVNPLAFSVFNDKNEWCGCILYSSGANPNLSKPYGLVYGQVIELTRMALNGKQESTSKVLAVSMRLLPKYAPTVKLIISFADYNQEHVGTIYQATNWYFTGIGKSTPQYYINGRWMHQRQVGSLGYDIKDLKNVPKRSIKDKFRYLYPVDKKLIPLCKELSKPYPKKENNSLSSAAVAQGSECQVSSLKVGGSNPTQPLKSKKHKS